jgi:hypothetical protein
LLLLFDQANIAWYRSTNLGSCTHSLNDQANIAWFKPMDAGSYLRLKRPRQFAQLFENFFLKQITEMESTLKLELLLVLTFLSQTNNSFFKIKMKISIVLFYVCLSVLVFLFGERFNICISYKWQIKIFKSKKKQIKQKVNSKRQDNLKSFHLQCHLR